jgi:hypothetical protein
VITLASVLFRCDRQICSKAAKKAVQKGDLDMLSKDVVSEHVMRQHQVEHFFERVWLAGGHRAHPKEEKDGEDKKEESKSDETPADQSPWGGAPSAPQRDSIGMAEQKTIDMMRKNRRQSIMEIGGFNPEAEGGGGDAEQEADMDVPSENDGSDENTDESSDDEDSVYGTVEVSEEEHFSKLIPIGSILEIACAAHLQQCDRQKLAIWTTVSFVNSDKHNKGNLSLISFRNAMEGVEPKKSYDELEQLFSDIVYASANNLMTFKTFKQACFKLHMDGMLQVPDVSDEDIQETALKLERGTYIERGE